MSKIKVFLGLTAACAACCAVPLALPMIAAAMTGAGIAGIGTYASRWELIVLGLGAVTVGTFLLIRRRRASNCESSNP